MSADAFALYLYELVPDDVDEVVDALVAKRTKRPVTAEELLEALRGPFPSMAASRFAAERDRRKT